MLCALTWILTALYLTAIVSQWSLHPYWAFVDQKIAHPGQLTGWPLFYGTFNNATGQSPCPVCENSNFTTQVGDEWVVAVLGVNV